MCVSVYVMSKREKERKRESVYVCICRYCSSSTCVAHAPTTKGTPSSLIPPLPLSRLTRTRMEREETGGEKEEGGAGGELGQRRDGGVGGSWIVGRQREDGGGLL